MWKILATSERYEIPNVASRSSVGINPKQLQMSMPIEPERRQFLWYFLYLCWDRPEILWDFWYLCGVRANNVSPKQRCSRVQRFIFSSRYTYQPR